MNRKQCMLGVDSEATSESVKSNSLYFCGSINKKSSLSVGHYELCRDDIGDLPGSPEHL